MCPQKDLNLHYLLRASVLPIALYGHVHTTFTSSCTLVRHALPVFYNSMSHQACCSYLYNCTFTTTPVHLTAAS